MISLFPKHEDFFTLFEKQGSVVCQGCELLLDMVEHFENVEQKATKLKDVEHEGDLITHEIFGKLNRTFITPLEREDIHGLASSLDNVLDAVEAIGSRFVLFRVKQVTPEAIQLARIVAQAGVQIEKAVKQLRDYDKLMPYTIELNRLENEADEVSRRVVADLFNGGHDPIDVLRWKELYGRLEAAADMGEDVANILEAIVLKNQ
jgi:predicted phosphate transport protein (TIGR00153 family)